MDHDRLFKELLTTFFVDFVEMFFPDLARYLDPESLIFLDKEVFTDVTQGERHEADVVVQAKFQQEPLFFLIHVETQAQAEAKFSQRMFRYFARLHEKYDLPVYPIALFSYDEPQRAESDTYHVGFSDFEVLSFRFRVVQLNRLDWRGFVDRTSPIVAALMARMHVEPVERVGVKLACLRMLARLQLDPARRELISGFVDSYLPLTMKQEVELGKELNAIEPHEREGVMEIVTSWMEKGLEQGLEEGRKEGREQGQQEEARELVRRLLRKRLGELDNDAEQQIEGLSREQLEELGEALLDFTAHENLASWLQTHAED